MTITLSWYMLVPIAWAAGIFGMICLDNKWYFCSDDWRVFRAAGIFPAILMLLTRCLP